MIEQAITTLRNAGFAVDFINMSIIVSLYHRNISTMEVKTVLDAAGIEAQYERFYGNVIVIL